MRIGIIGGGFMGEAFLRGVLHSELAAPGEIAVADLADARRAQLRDYGVRVTDDAESACIGADLVLLAVKPQDLSEVARSLQGKFAPNAVIVSIAAGITLEEVRRSSGHRFCVRVMPNLPAAIGEGAAVFLSTPEVTPSQIGLVRGVLDAVATAVIEVHDDDEIDLATALHGSGPAYVYLLIESMVDAGVRLGMKRPDATRLVLATVVGAARYQLESGRHPAELRNAVTSPGGTTAAAIAELESSGFRAAIDEAIEAAYLRAVELGE